MATIEKRINSKGETSYRALVRIKGHPSVSNTFAQKTKAEEWAKKSVNANLNVQKSKTLISMIEKVQDDALFAKAKTIKEYKALADKGYARAYAPLAELYLENGKYKEANKYATKAIKANVGKNTAISVVKKMEIWGLYDDKSIVKPNF